MKKRHEGILDIYDPEKYQRIKIVCSIDCVIEMWDFPDTPSFKKIKKGWNGGISYPLKAGDRFECTNDISKKFRITPSTKEEYTIEITDK